MTSSKFHFQKLEIGKLLGRYFAIVLRKLFILIFSLENDRSANSASISNFKYKIKSAHTPGCAVVKEECSINKTLQFLLLFLFGQYNIFKT